MFEQDDRKDAKANVDTMNMFSHLLAGESTETQARLLANIVFSEAPKTIEELFSTINPGSQEPHIVFKFHCSKAFYQMHCPSSLRSSPLESTTIERNEEHEDDFKEKEEAKIKEKILKYIQNSDKYYNLLTEFFEEFEKLTPESVDEIWDVYWEQKIEKIKARPEYDENYKKIYHDTLNELREDRKYQTSKHYYALEEEAGSDLLIDYCYVTFTDFLFIFIKTLAYFSRFQFSIEFTNFTEYFLIHIWGDENEYSKLAAYQGYELMMKQFAIKYQIAYQKTHSDYQMLQEKIEVKAQIDAQIQPLLDEEIINIPEDILPLRPNKMDFKTAIHWAPHQRYSQEKENLFQRYDKSDLHHECPEENGCKNCSIFRNIDKLRIAYDTLDRILKFNALRKRKLLEEIFIVRNFNDYESRLEYKSIVFAPWNVYNKPVQQEFVFLIRNFFNETISYYFLWLINYLQWLICPTIFGLLIYAISWLPQAKPNDTLDAGDTLKIVFAGLTVIWGSLFLFQWRAKEQLYNYIWGTENFKHFEPDREEFIPEREEAIMFGQKFPFQSRSKSLMKFCVSYLVLFVFVLITCGLIIFVFWLKKLVQDKINDSHETDESFNSWDFLGYCLIGLNPVQIKVMNFIYCFIAEKLNRWENHQKEFEKVNSNNIKMIMFDFVNNYFACFYIVFIKKNLTGSWISVDSECYGFGNDKTCIQELEISLYTTLAIFGAFNFMELGLPIAMQLFRFRQYREVERAKNPNTQIKITDIKRFSITYLELCDDYNDVSAEYGEMLILYGYVALFGLAAPLVPSIAMILVLIEKFVDTFKLFFLVRVSILDGSTGIEMYKIIMQGFIYIGIITNAAIICFTDKNLSDMATNVIVFIGLVMGYFFLAMISRFSNLPKWFQYKDELVDLYTSKTKEKFDADIIKMQAQEKDKHDEEAKRLKIGAKKKLF